MDRSLVDSTPHTQSGFDETERQSLFAKARTFLATQGHAPADIDFGQMLFANPTTAAKGFMAELSQAERDTLEAGAMAEALS